MTYLYYSDRFLREGRLLEKLLRSTIGNNAISRLPTIILLAQQLMRPQNLPNKPNLYVLWAGDSADINAFLKIRELLADVRCVLILPDQNATTIAQGHSLQPRHIGFADDDHAITAEIIKKLVHTGHPQPFSPREIPS